MLGIRFARVFAGQWGVLVELLPLLAAGGYSFGIRVCVSSAATARAGGMAYCRNCAVLVRTGENAFFLGGNLGCWVGFEWGNIDCDE